MTTKSTVSEHSSLHELTTAFANARHPRLSDLLGAHDGSFAGPLWLRLPAPLLLAATGMAGWCGKSFQNTRDAHVIAGHNLARRGGRIVESIPITAQIARARSDNGPALIVSYPPDAAWPWRHVTDELRPVDDHTLLGLTYGIPATPPAGAPFLLRRH
ncbi:hypothetical protein [Nocardia vaccinii]|uniref:hypothetical protein n=1 Tax=Nocardia vaccinii TaxID=1822 RepID=UPI00082CA3EE|nr:hypothetical protein [Nocardia vaccinii]